MNKKAGNIKVSIFLILLALFIFYLKRTTVYKENVGNSSKSACMINLKTLSVALQMYNMESQQQIKTDLPDPTRRDCILVKNGFLRDPVSKPDPACEYYIEGELPYNGRLCCKKHGSYDGKKPEYAEEPGQR